MKLVSLKVSQSYLLEAVRDLARELGLAGETVVVDDVVVYQAPVSGDADVSGAMFVMEPSEPNVRLHLVLPLVVPRERMAAAWEFVATSGACLKFGALELSSEQGGLRVRIDSDAQESTAKDAVTRIFQRGMALAREVSPRWRALCRQLVEPAVAGPNDPAANEPR